MSALLKKMFYPVIHCLSPYGGQGFGHALRNTRIAMDNGADGVFLIGHRIPFGDLVDIYETVRKQFPDIWIGINFLDISHEKNWAGLSTVVRKCHGLNGLWIDEMPNEKLDIPKTIQVFGGVAFKYIDPHLDGKALAEACERAVSFVDVATTSGDKTGSAPDVKKLEAIKKNLAGRIPLALASGVNSSNASEFLGTVDIFFVASSITEINDELGSNEYLVPEKVEEMAILFHR